MKLRQRSRFFAALTAVAVGAAAMASIPGAPTAGALGTNSTIVCANGTTAPGGVIEYDLEARDGYIQFPDGNTVYAWSYAEASTPLFQFPGPNLCVDEGATVRVNLTNPDHISNFVGGIPADATSIVFPGQTSVVSTGGVPGLLTNEVQAPTDTVTYEFVAGAPGTYMYQSGSNQAVQLQMGMFGGLVIYPAAGRDHAYAGTQFDPNHEYLLLFHEIDPDLHTAVELASMAGSVTDATVLADYDPLARHNRYFTINGRSFPDTLAANNTPILPTQPYSSLVEINAKDPDTGNPNQLPGLVRYGNAGLDNHPFHPHGNHLTLIAQDARALPDEVESYTKTVAAGQTFDLLAEWTDVEAWQGTGAPQAINVPALGNLVFKGGVTFYSGDEDLGQTGQLPVGTTTFTACGEYYFPWHSHALQEVQNYDQPTGGMLTLWRVNPPMVQDAQGNWVTPPECQ